MADADDADDERLLVVLPPGLQRRQVAPLARRVSRILAERHPRVVECRAARARPATLADVEAIARLKLAARRSGAGLVVSDPPPDLLDLLGLCGLARIFALEPGREAEQREPARGVQEERDPGDPVAPDLDDL